jgi:uncharacterized protein YcfJ
MSIMRVRATAVLVLLALLGACASHGRRLVPEAAQGQTPQELDRDRFACAVEAQQGDEEHLRDPMRAGTLVGAVAGGAVGSALGAIVGSFTWVVGKGAISGAVLGGAVGAPVGGTIGHARIVNAYEQRFAACLEARGYDVVDKEIVP